MALTMTRTRTQTTLTKLAQMLADINGELSFITGVLEYPLVTLLEGDQARLQDRRAILERNRAAVCITIRQFDPELDPETVGESSAWFKTRRRKPSSRQSAYLAWLMRQS